MIWRCSTVWSKSLTATIIQWHQRKDLISDALPDVSLGSAGSQFAEGYPTKWGINSFFGRVNYGFKDKYLFEANIRTDGSSRFAKGHKWGVSRLSLLHGVFRKKGL